MKLQVCSLLTTFALAAPAFAAMETDETYENHGEMVVTMMEQSLFPTQTQMPASCTAVKLDDTQKAALRQAYFDYSKQKNIMVANIKNAWLDVGHTLMSSTSTKDEGMNVLNAFRTSENALGQLMGTLASTVFYDILKPEQRMSGWMCMRDLEKMKRQKMLSEMCAKLPHNPMATPTK
ncbi:MAG: hypothetical protein ACXVCP_02115 [Bdellovibrio sp.]